MMSRLKIVRPSLAVAAALALTFGGAASAQASDTKASADVVEQAFLAGLETQLLRSAAAGDSLAKENLEALAALSGEQRDELGEILAGQSTITAAEPSANAEISVLGNTRIAVDGDAVWGLTETVVNGDGAGEAGTLAVAAIRSIWGTQWFAFAGITLTETKVWGEYNVSGSTVTSIIDWGAQLVVNYQPFTTVTVTEHSAVRSGGSVTFKGKVRVERGPVYGWYWSTVESYHTVTGNAAGSVTFNGWT